MSNCLGHHIGRPGSYLPKVRAAGMADYTVRWIIGRALNDKNYREWMERDPQAAWAGYELTPLDLSELKSWTPERIQAVLSDLSEQINNAVFDGAAGFILEDPSAASNCDEGFSLQDFQKFFGAE